MSEPVAWRARPERGPWFYGDGPDRPGNGPQWAEYQPLYLAPSTAETEALRKDAERWRAIKHAVHLKEHGRQIVTNWAAWINEPAISLDDAIDQYAKENASYVKQEQAK